MLAKKKNSSNPSPVLYVGKNSTWISRCKHPPLHSFAKLRKIDTASSPEKKICFYQSLLRALKLPFCPFNSSFTFNPSLMSEHYYYYFPQLHIVFHIYTIHATVKILSLFINFPVV
ncbi:hypothetical protein K450DRAFT_259396 [Umbelopsis ramanniana AG]|uniref:Uncharacterized protein n=1 Tax=Umbelopsis ramanniana AG TaxID=1314678 RepID=A0AAD5E5C4_UMBRA|nr:uncharacterized protein K450DRAFT_259396 [Umbelopsis ramanniana AG]KAI8575920.1 hypothetical protein K450DRAFT_259396 [Umbelopsis ramanniana AG]